MPAILRRIASWMAAQTGGCQTISLSKAHLVIPHPSSFTILQPVRFSDIQILTLSFLFNFFLALSPILTSNLPHQAWVPFFGRLLQTHWFPDSLGPHTTSLPKIVLVVMARCEIEDLSPKKRPLSSGKMAPLDPLIDPTGSIKFLTGKTHRCCARLFFFSVSMEQIRWRDRYSPWIRSQSDQRNVLRIPGQLADRSR
jgi:hypothetical protein